MKRKKIARYRKAKGARNRYQIKGYISNSRRYRKRG